MANGLMEKMERAAKIREQLLAPGGRLGNVLRTQLLAELVAADAEVAALEDAAVEAEQAAERQREAAAAAETVKLTGKEG